MDSQQHVSLNQRLSISEAAAEMKIAVKTLRNRMSLGLQPQPIRRAGERPYFTRRQIENWWKGK